LLRSTTGDEVFVFVPEAERVAGPLAPLSNWPQCGWIDTQLRIAASDSFVLDADWLISNLYNRSRGVETYAFGRLLIEAFTALTVYIQKS